MHSPESDETVEIAGANVIPMPVNNLLQQESLPQKNSSDSIPDGFEQLPDGIYYMPSDMDEAEPIFICSPLRVDALFRDADDRGCGRVVGVKTVDGHWHHIPILDAELFRRQTDTIAKLVDHGLELGAAKVVKQHFPVLLKQWKPEKRLLTVERSGWVDDKFDTFLVGSKIIGSREVLPPAISAVIRTSLTACGTVDDWKQNVAMKCRGNPLLILAVSLAFSGALLAPLGMHGGGLHFRGSSSSGKTTLLKLAASVWGGDKLISQWRATTNGLEAIAGSMNDMLLPLDEIGEISARELPDAIYMLANGIGKTRMTKDVSLEDQARWRVALISSGEISIAEKLSEAGRQAMDGHHMRLIDVEVDSHAHGVFDDLHGAASGAVFADSLQQAVNAYHGSIGPAFMEWLTSMDSKKFWDVIRSEVRKRASNWSAMLPTPADGQTARVAKRFAAIGIAGYLATRCGFTGWDVDEPSNAAKQAFLDWYDWRYSAQQDAVSGKRDADPLLPFLI